MEKEEDKTIWLADINWFPILMGGLCLAILFSLAFFAHKKNARMIADYETYGCYRVEKEYQECGPIEGKPGFTRCETKKKLVCPEVSN